MAKHTVFNEQRTATRKIVKVKARLVIDGQAPVVARTVDVSSAGMCIQVAEPCRTGVSCQISFDLFYDGKSTPISARSKIAYCILSGNEFKVGLVFQNLDLSAMTALARFLR